MSTIRFFGNAHGHPLEKGPYNAHSYRFVYEPETYGWNSDGNLRSVSIYKTYICFGENELSPNFLSSWPPLSISVEITSHAGIHVFSKIKHTVIHKTDVLTLKFMAEEFEQREGPTPLVQKKENGKPVAFDENADFGRKIRF